MTAYAGRKLVLTKMGKLANGDLTFPNHFQSGQDRHLQQEKFIRNYTSEMVLIIAD